MNWDAFTTGLPINVVCNLCSSYVKILPRLYNKGVLPLWWYKQMFVLWRRMVAVPRVVMWRQCPQYHRCIIDERRKDEGVQLELSGRNKRVRLKSYSFWWRNKNMSVPRVRSEWRRETLTYNRYGLIPVRWPRFSAPEKKKGR